MAAVFAIFALATPFPTVSAAAPIVSHSIPSIYLAAGTSDYGALDLSDYFSVAPGRSLAFEVVPDGHASTVIALALRGPLLDVIVAYGGRSAWAAFAVVACDSNAPLDCVRSHTFEVIVGGARTGSGTPPAAANYSVLGLPSMLGPGSALELQIIGEQGPPSGPVHWSVDGVEFGQGTSATLVTPAPGDHLLEVRGEGDTVLVRVHFQAQSPLKAPGFGAAFLPPWLSLLLPAALGAALVGSAKVRGPVLWFAIGMIARRSPRDAPLDHFRRGALHQLIKDNPGIHFSELRRRAGISTGTCAHHLKVLEDAGYIHSRPIGAKTHYSTTARVPHEDTFGLTDVDERVLVLVHATPGISLSELSVRLGKSRGTVSRSISRLALLGYVTTGRAQRQRIVLPRAEKPLPERLRIPASLSPAEGGTLP